MAKLGSHHPIKHLIEVDEAIVHIDAHLDDNALDVEFSGAIGNAHLLTNALRQSVEEVVDVLDFELHALVPTRVVTPSLFEVLKVFFKPCSWVVILNVILGELLNDDQHEQIEHDVSHQKDEAKEEKWSDVGATSFALDAVQVSVHAVIHDPVPVLSC